MHECISNITSSFVNQIYFVISIFSFTDSWTGFIIRGLSLSLVGVNKTLLEDKPIFQVEKYKIASEMVCWTQTHI